MLAIGVNTTRLNPFFFIQSAAPVISTASLFVDSENKVLFQWTLLGGSGCTLAVYDENNENVDCCLSERNKSTVEMKKQ